MTLSRKSKWFIALAVVALGLAAAGAVLVQRLTNLETYRSEIISSVQQSLRRQLTYDRGEFALSLMQGTGQTAQQSASFQAAAEKSWPAALKDVPEAGRPAARRS